MKIGHRRGVYRTWNHVILGYDIYRRWLCLDVWVCIRKFWKDILEKLFKRGYCL